MNEFRNLVFEGGGVKGIAYGGALEELNTLNILPKINRVAGTSAGAINALLLAIGYEVSEVSRIVAETNFADFEDTPYPKKWQLRRWYLNIKKTLRVYGWHKGDEFTVWLVDKIERKSIDPNITFAQFNELVKADQAAGSPKGLMELYVFGTNLSQKTVIAYSHKKTPNTKIKDAIRISMSIPMYFEAKFNEGGDVLVDGGVTYNYPINIFDNVEYLENQANGEEFDYDIAPGFIFNHETLGFRLDSSATIDSIQNGTGYTPATIDGFKSYAGEILGLLMEAANRRHIHGNDWERTVFIDTLDVGTTQFDISQERIDALMEEGRKGVRKHFEWRNGADGKDKPS